MDQPLTIEEALKAISPLNIKLLERIKEFLSSVMVGALIRIDVDLETDLEDNAIFLVVQVTKPNDQDGFMLDVQLWHVTEAFHMLAIEKIYDDVALGFIKSWEATEETKLH